MLLPSWSHFGDNGFMSKPKTSDARKRKPQVQPSVVTAPVVAPGAPAHGLPPEMNPEAAFHHFRAEAVLVKGAKVCRADPPIVLENLKDGVNAILPHLPAIVAGMPLIALAPVLELPNLCRGLLFAAGRCVPTATKGEIARKVRRARELRKPMLLIAEGLSLIELLPKARIARIRAGSGSYDTGRDLVDLVGLYREFAAALLGKQPFGEAFLAEAEGLGVWILANVKPGGAARKKPEIADAARLRDQFWALVVARYSDLHAIAGVLFREAADSHVPPLQRRRDSGAKAAPTPAPTP